MDRIGRHIEREVSADGARDSVRRVCCSYQVSCDSDHIWSLPHHEKNRARGHVRDKFLEEGLVTVNRIQLPSLVL